MKVLAVLVALAVSGFSVGPAVAATGYTLTIENPGSTFYHVEVIDRGTVHRIGLGSGGMHVFSVESQTPAVKVSAAGCAQSATPSIKTYVTLALGPNCKITTKAAGISGF